MADMLATPDELRTFIGRDDVDDAHATLALTLATGLVQNACRQRLVYVTNDAIELASKRRPYLMLPERPVVAVSLVEVVDHGATEYRAIEPDWQVVNSVALIHGQALDWDYRRVRVMYDHGFAVVPEDLRTVALGVAMRIVTNPTGVRSEQIGSYSYSLAGPGESVGPGGLTVFEREVCNRYRWRTYAMR